MQTNYSQYIIIQSDNCSMCGFYCSSFIEYMIADKALLGCTNLFLSNDYQKNDKIIYKYFKENYGKRKHKLRF